MLQSSQQQWIDFNNLLNGAMFSTHTQQPVTPPIIHPLTHASDVSPEWQVSSSANTHLSSKSNSFALWMEALNIYTSTLLSAKQSCAIELLGYQCLNTSVNLQLLLSAWMTYDIEFCTNHSSLCWDIRHLDLWLKYLMMSKPAASE